MKPLSVLLFSICTICSSLLWSCQSAPPVRQQVPLLEGWRVHSLAVAPMAATVPGVVQSDLIEAGILPHPWWGMQENDVQWVDTLAWVYEKSFEWQPGPHPEIDLVFEGLDTYATIYLNGQAIQVANNMFRAWHIPIKPYLVPGTNHLKVVFPPLLATARPLKNALPYPLPASGESVVERVSPFVRKAPYHFGWDWGPRILTVGIWKPVYLDLQPAVRLLHAQISTESLTQEVAETLLQVTVAGQQSSGHTYEIEAFGKRIPLPKEGPCQLPYRIENPQWWWPNGWGKPTLYETEVVLLENGHAIDRLPLRFGLRTVELIQEPDSMGTSFYFKVNGQPLFAKGANYIPPSHFLPEVKPDYYETLLEKAQQAHINMLRVWGGGIYEQDRFYELCDERGILVWQDFMFANTTYPGDSAFLENVGAEIDEQVTRLRNHPSLAHWNGNNEIAVAWHHWGWQQELGYSPSDSARQWQDYLHLFENLIPDKIRQLDPGRSYTPTSPLSNWGKPEDFRHGSMHYWGVWHGQEDFDAYPQHVGRFMAEYGFQSFPDTSTIAKFAPHQDWHLNSSIMRHHQKSYIGNAMIHRMVQQYLGQADDFTDWVMRSQEVQALAMEKAIDAHRWERARCGGTLFWQLNDCWPGPSWSAIDVYGREKILFQRLPNLFAPIALLGRTTGQQLELRLANDRLEEAKVLVQMVDSLSGKLLWEQEIKAQANSLSTIFQGPKPTQPVSLRVMEGAQLLYERPFRE